MTVPICATDTDHRSYPQGSIRHGTCVRCLQRMPAVPDGWRERDVTLERYLTDVAARAAGKIETDPVTMQERGDTGGLDEFADARCLPGPVQTAGRDLDREAAEELADCRNYLLWGIEPIYERACSGDADASAIYDRRMRALSKIIEAWHELHTQPG